VRRGFGLLVASWAALAVAACGGGKTTQHVSLTASSPSPLVDSPVDVRMRGLQPHVAVTLRASWTGFGRAHATSSETLRAGNDGTIDLRGIEGMRFLWSMHVTPADRSFTLPATDDTLVRLTLASDGKAIAHTVFHRRAGAPGLGLRTLTAKRDGLVGFFFTPQGSTARRPSVLVVGGSEGGIEGADIAALLASHGYPALALGYFGLPGLPRELRNIPLEYFHRALQWMARQPSVDPKRTTMIGVSRGAETALLSAVRFPTVVHAAIAMVPNSSEAALSPDGRSPAWTYHGRPLPEAPIPVERIRGPILDVGAEADAQGPSSLATKQIEQRLAEHHFRFFHQRLDYPGAGHDIGSLVPYLPQPDPIHFGGTPRASATAKVDLWPRLLDFLKRIDDKRA
jgi:dienelactone hydrolase